MRDLLEHYGLQTVVLRIGEGKFREVPLPFVTQISRSEGVELFFTIVEGTVGSGVRCLDPLTGRWTVIPETDFKNRWSGVVLISFRKEGVPPGEPEYSVKRKKEVRNKAARFLFFSGIPVLFILAIVDVTGRLPANAVGMPLVYVALAFAGAMMSSVLTWQEMAGGTRIFEAFCRGGNTDCNAVLQSAGAKIFGCRWSVLGFVYFWAIAIGLVANGIREPTALYFISWLSFAALPFTVYSVLYQWRVVRRWCRLCLAVQAVLFLQGVIVFADAWWRAEPGDHWPLVVLRLVLGGLIPLGYAIFVLPLASQMRNGVEAFKRLGRIKRDPLIFRTLMAGQEMSNAGTEGLGLVLGNRNAAHTLIKVCNPYCKHCAVSHAVIRELLRKLPDIKVQIIFTGMHELSPVRHFLSLAETGDELLLEAALDSWYSGSKEYKQLARRYPANKEMLGCQDAKIEAMRDWCKKMKIEYTPTYLLDGKRLPGLYGISDLEWLFPRRQIQREEFSQ
jgi:uncharacterized membrane protein